MPRQPSSRIACEYFTWNLFLRNDTWYADGRHNKPDLGKHSLGTTDRDEAERRLHQLDAKKAVELGRAKPAARSPPDAVVSIEEGWRRYLEHVGRPSALGGASAKTQQRYRAVRDKHVKHCAKRGIEYWGDVDKAALKDYLQALSREEYDDNTLYTEGTLIKQVIIWLIDEKTLPESARIRLKLSRSHESDTYCYSREQVQAMIALCRGAPALLWLSNVIFALATTGMRIGELAALRWSDVNLQSGLITIADNRHSGRAKKAGAVKTTKGRRTRRVDIHPLLRAVLEQLPHRTEGGPVFRAAQGGTLDPDKVLKVLQRDVIGPLKKRFPTPQGEIGFEHGVTHSLRHYFVTEAFLGGATEGQVQDWVGHRDSRIVRRYRHLRPGAAQETMARLKLLDAEPPALIETQPVAAETQSKETNSNREADGPNGSVPGEHE